MVVTSYTAGEGSVSMVLSVTRFGMSFASFSSVAAFAWSQNALPHIGRCPRSDKGKAPVFSRRLTCDLVLQDFHAPRSFTIIDIKIVDPSAASYVQATAESALHRHRALEAAGPRDYFGPSRRPPPGARMTRVVTFVICNLYLWFPWCSSSSPHQGHRQTHQPLRAFFTCP